jgi:hypothetical protein
MSYTDWTSSFCSSHRCRGGARRLLQGRCSSPVAGSRRAARAGHEGLPLALAPTMATLRRPGIARLGAAAGIPPVPGERRGSPPWPLPETRERRGPHPLASMAVARDREEEWSLGLAHRWSTSAGGNCVRCGGARAGEQKDRAPAWWVGLVPSEARRPEPSGRRHPASAAPERIRRLPPSAPHGGIRQLPPAAGKEGARQGRVRPELTGQGAVDGAQRPGRGTGAQQTRARGLGEEGTGAAAERTEALPARRRRRGGPRRRGAFGAEQGQRAGGSPGKKIKERIVTT